MAIRDRLHEVHGQLTAFTVDTRRRAIVSLSEEQEYILDSLSSLGELPSRLNKREAMERKANVEWFLKHNSIKEWDNASVPSTLVLTGHPGSGKSSICQVTRFYLKAWHQSEPDICVAYLYFAFSFLQIKGLSESQVLSNIVQQIVRQYP